MKIRNGFVSNSSSSSFVLPTDCVTVAQLNKIKNHIGFAKKFKMGYVTTYDEWDIVEDEKFIRGSTNMDNFDMAEFMEKIGIDMSKVEWGG